MFSWYALRRPLVPTSGRYAPASGATHTWALSQDDYTHPSTLTPAGGAYLADAYLGVVAFDSTLFARPGVGRGAFVTARGAPRPAAAGRLRCSPGRRESA